MQVRQVLVTVKFVQELQIANNPDRFISSGCNAAPHGNETRLVYVPQFTVETPSLQDFIKEGKATDKDDDGNLLAPAEQMRQLNKALEEYMPLNADRINREIEAKTSEYIDKSVRDYYGDRFISVEIHETIGMKQTVGLV